MKTKHTKPKSETASIPVPHSLSAVLPASLLAGLKYFSVCSRACCKDGSILAGQDRLMGSSVRSRLLVSLGGDAGLVSRISALLLLQVGGRSTLGPSRNFGGSFSLVILPVGVVLEVR